MRSRLRIPRRRAGSLVGDPRSCSEAYTHRDAPDVRPAIYSTERFDGVRRYVSGGCNQAIGIGGEPAISATPAAPTEVLNGNLSSVRVNPQM